MVHKNQELLKVKGKPLVDPLLLKLNVFVLNHNHVSLEILHGT